MSHKDTTLVAWGEGDRTVGDGTFHAELTVDSLLQEMVPFLKEEMAKALSQVWDLAPKRITVMTKEEYEVYTKEEGCGCRTSDPLLHCTPCCNGPDCGVCSRGDG